MPKPKSKNGGKKKRRGKNVMQEKRKLEFAEDGQVYVRVLKMLGDGRLEGKCSDGQTRICHIRGKFRKRVWINAEDLVLADIRSYQPDKADVVYKYDADEDRTLSSYGELTHGTAKEDKEDAKDHDRNEIQFDQNSSSDSDSDSIDENEDAKDILEKL